MEKPFVNIKYIFNEDYNPTYVNGVYGGPSLGGELILNFYLERQPIPKDVKYELTDEGMLGEVLEISPKQHSTNVVRIVSNGIVVSLDSAKKLNNWLSVWIHKMEENSDEQLNSDEVDGKFD